MAVVVCKTVNKRPENRWHLLPSLCTTLALIVAGCGATSYPKFDGDTAFDHLKAQCDFGPRPPGSAAHRKCGDYIVRALKPLADTVYEQRFQHYGNPQALALRNIIALFNPAAEDWVILCAHWDTRPMADQEVDQAKARKPILGANDGASGVAALLELARLFKEKPPSVGVMMVFFDGEDYGRTPDLMFLGSKYFAQHWRSMKRPDGKPLRLRYGILLDMIGDRNLNIHRERFSQGRARDVVDKVWRAAGQLGYRDAFPDSPKYFISDDHTALLAAGIKCIDVIDFDYAYWHTLDDTVDKCSPKSLRIVGEVIAKVVYEEPQRLTPGKR